VPTRIIAITRVHHKLLTVRFHDRAQQTDVSAAEFDVKLPSTSRQTADLGLRTCSATTTVETVQPANSIQTWDSNDSFAKIAGRNTAWHKLQKIYGIGARYRPTSSWRVDFFWVIDHTSRITLQDTIWRVCVRELCWKPIAQRSRETKRVANPCSGQRSNGKWRSFASVTWD
jgi:hypothetical protein